MSTDVVVIGGGHNGLVCACYLARAGLDVIVLERSESAGGCVATDDLPDGRGRLERGAYEHGGLVASGVHDDLQLESFGLSFVDREEVFAVADGEAPRLTFHVDLEVTVERITQALGRLESERYHRLATWAGQVMALLGTTERGVPMSMRDLATVAESTLGREADQMLRTMLASASSLVRAQLEDERLRAALSYPAVWLQLPPSEPGTGGAVLKMAGAHGRPPLRARNGGRAIVDALTSCLERAGGRLSCCSEVASIEVSGGRATGVVTGDARIGVRRAVVSSIDARRVFEDLISAEDVPPRLANEVRTIQVGQHNLGKFKLDAVCEAGDLGTLGGASILSAGSLTDFERGFAQMQLGMMPDRPPIEMGFPSRLEPGWAPQGQEIAWLSTLVPLRLEGGEAWSEERLDEAADRVWQLAERALGSRLTAIERQIIGPDGWIARTGNRASDANHVSMTPAQLFRLRPSPSLSGYRTPLPGLYLTGAGTHPGGGVTGAPGRNAASVILADMGRRRRESLLRRSRRLAAQVRDLAWATRELRRG